MTEYWVSHIKKEANDIKKVRAFINTVEGIKYPTIFKKKDVLKSLQKKQDNWYTCFLKDKKGQRRIWEKQKKIKPVEVDGNKYLRVDDKTKNSDHLGDLPSLKSTTDEEK